MLQKRASAFYKFVETVSENVYLLLEAKDDIIADEVETEQVRVAEINPWYLY